MGLQKVRQEINNLLNALLGNPDGTAAPREGMRRGIFEQKDPSRLFFKKKKKREGNSSRMGRKSKWPHVANTGRRRENRAAPRSPSQHLHSNGAVLRRKNSLCQGLQRKAQSGGNSSSERNSTGRQQRERSASIKSRDYPARIAVGRETPELPVPHLLGLIIKSPFALGSGFSPDTSTQEPGGHGI